MATIHDARLRLRNEIEAPPALRKFGSGWISGILGFVLAAGGLLLVLSIRMPGFLTMPETRQLQDNHWFRLALHFILIGAFALSLLSLVLRKGKTLGTCGVVAVVLATMIGGSRSAAIDNGHTQIF